MDSHHSFYVCFFKNKEGRQIGHRLATEDKFPEALRKEITIGPRLESDSSEIFKEFCRSILGHMDMLPMLAVVGSIIAEGIRDTELIEFCEKNALNVRKEETRDVYRIGVEYFSGYRSIEERAATSQLVSKQVAKMLLIGVVSSLDYHLSRLMKQVLRKYPKMISDSDKQISVRDIFRSDSLEEFKDFLLERELENITRDSFEEQIAWFEKRLGIEKPIKNDYSKWDSLVEIIERRNLFAHADGIVNNTYLKKIAKVGSSTGVSKGDELFASRKYFKAALDNICEFGVKISQVVWRKLHPDQAEMADDALGEFGYNLIERGEYNLAVDILDFAVNEIKGKKKEQRRRMDIVNLSNAYRLSGKEKEAEATLAAEDWNIVSDEFAISVAAIRGDVGRVIGYMHRLAQSGEWDGSELEQWAVFFHVREDPLFQEAYEKLYDRKFTPAPKNRHRILNIIGDEEDSAERKMIEKSPRKARKSRIIDAEGHA